MNEPDLDYILSEERDRNGFQPRLPLSDFHDECGYAWSIHDSRKVAPGNGWRTPFGCPPSETLAQERWGR